MFISKSATTFHCSVERKEYWFNFYIDFYDEVLENSGKQNDKIKRKIIN